MTRKDYVAVAAEIAACMDDVPTLELTSTTIATLARQLGMMFQRDNGRFDTQRFLIACGVERRSVLLRRLHR